jgi:5-formyltetrahydrofolate cyclo-ligase
MNSPSKNSPKSLLRNKLKKKIASISAVQRRTKSRSVCLGLWKSDFVQEARSILLYVGRKDELDTKPLILKLLSAGKAVYLPRMEGAKIVLYRVKNLKTDLEAGAFGILEPKRILSRQGRIQEIDTALIPGLGFTREGVRLGRGAGYFDRLLAKANKTVKIGVAYREQIIKKIPALKHDIRMNFVVTD